MKHCHILSSTHSSASILTKLYLVHETISTNDGILFETQGKVHASSSTGVTRQAFQAIRRKKADDCDNDIIQVLELHNQAYVVVITLVRDPKF